VGLWLLRRLLWGAIAAHVFAVAGVLLGITIGINLSPE